MDANQKISDIKNLIKECINGNKEAQREFTDTFDEYVEKRLRRKFRYLQDTDIEDLKHSFFLK